MEQFPILHVWGPRTREDQRLGTVEDYRARSLSCPSIWGCGVPHVSPVLRDVGLCRSTDFNPQPTGSQITYPTSAPDYSEQLRNPVTPRLRSTPEAVEQLPILNVVS